MRAPRVYRTEAVVLKAYDLGEADRILTLYTPQLGKVRAVAKGIRRTRSRKAGHLDLFTRSSLLLARGRQLDIVTQAETVESFGPVRDDLARIAACTYAAELADSFGMEGLANNPLYVLVVHAFRRIAVADDLPLVLRAFELHLLGRTGYRPQLHRCLQCDTIIAPGHNRFSSRLGGVLCPSCGSADGAAQPISVAALKAMRNLQTNEDAMLAIRDLDDDVHHEVERRLQEYLLYRLESRPKSLAFLERLRSEVSAAAPTPRV